MTDRVSLARIATRSALQTRRTLSISRESPINVYDVAMSLGVEVQFVDQTSLEGMFYRGPNPKILLPTWEHRPKGRIAFSCAHELGHFELGHGTRVDEYVEDNQYRNPKNDDEFGADTYASTLLMPRQAVLQRFVLRDWNVDSATPLQLFVVAGELDVGYSTLLLHLRYGLELVDDRWLRDRRKVTPKALRLEICQSGDAPRVTVVDRFWSDIPIDVEVGDLIAVPSDSLIEGTELVYETMRYADYSLWSVRRPGKTQIRIDNRVYVVRVARANFSGFLKYRFLDDPDDL